MSAESSVVDVSSVSVKNRGWTIALAGLGINLALGVLYTWSIVSKGIPEEWGWSEAARSLPYSVAFLVFSLIMIPAGRMQDRIGPQVIASIGGLVAGVVVSGFGLAIVYVAPLVKALIQSYGLSTTLMVLGVGFLIIVVGLS